MIVTIDGPSGTGKSTTARSLAKKLGFCFFDTGALYRSLAWWLEKEGKEASAIADILPSFAFQIVEEDDGKRYFVGKEEVTDLIRKPEISEKASQIAAIAPIREALLPLQREYAVGRDVVFEGRDLGSVVFPRAEVKIFLTARPEVRALRRCRQMEASGKVGIAEEILQAQKRRDEKDSTRSVAPLVCPEGAFTLDTSDIVQEEVIQILYQYVLSRKNTCKGG
jgi:CMP/dCMP kinase